jgi:hypothetical protein
MPQRLDAHVFDLPVQELRRGYLSDIYFWREKVTLEDHNLKPEVSMQVFQKKEAVLCGVDEAIAVLKLAAGKYTDYDTAYKLFDQLIDLKDTARRQFIGNHNAYLKTIEQKMEVSRQLDELWQSGYDQLNVTALYDGDTISPWPAVLHIWKPSISAYWRAAQKLPAMSAALSMQPTGRMFFIFRRALITGRCRVAMDTPPTSGVPPEFPPTPRPNGGAPRLPARYHTP